LPIITAPRGGGADPTANKAAVNTKKCGDWGIDDTTFFVDGSPAGEALINSCYAKAPLSPVLKADSNSIALFSDAM
jgi:hypothetical protein